MADVCVKQVVANLRERELSIPYWEIDSGRSGPVFLITCALHGNEVQGVEALRRMLPEFSRDLQAGSVLMLPFGNPLAVRNRRPHMDSGPETPYSSPDVVNINSTWPGKADGNDAERITYALHRDLLQRSTHNLDIHAWPAVRGGTVIFREGHKQAEEMARLTTYRFLQSRFWRPEAKQRPILPCVLTAWFVDTGRLAVCLEPSGQYGFFPREVDRTERAIRNCGKWMGLLPGEPEGMDEPVVWLGKHQQATVVAPCAGLFSPMKGLEVSDRVEEGAILGHFITDPDLKIHEIRAPASGWLWTFGRYQLGCDVSLAAQHPYADAGDTLAEIVS